METVAIVAAVLVGLAILRYIRKNSIKEGKVQNANFTEITTLPQLDNLFAANGNEKHLLYLHDPWCPVSSRAIREVAQVETDVATVDVSSHRELSSEIERRTGIRHESPQAFVIENGAAIWSASHGGINSLALSLALDDTSEAASTTP